MFVLAPLLQRSVQPWLIAHLGPLPLIGRLFTGPPYGIGIGTAGVVLAIMVLPYLTAVMRDVFETVPVLLKEAAYGLGATTWEVVWNVVTPYARSGIVGGVMLGLGRALGETMAVTFVIGNAHRINASLLAPGTTISATIANEFTEGGWQSLHLLAHCARPRPHGDHSDRDHCRASDAAPLGAARVVTGMRKHARRRLINRVALGCALLATLVALGMLTAILVTLVTHGTAGLSTSLFTKMTPPPGGSGGLANAMYGSFMLTLLAIVIGAPIGILAGTYLAEYGRDTRVAAVVRFVNDILLSAPSIIIGLFVYEILIVRVRHFSAIAGGDRARDHRHPSHRPYHRGHAGTRTPGRTRRLDRPRRAALAHHLEYPLSGREVGPAHRSAARGGEDQRRDGAALVHGPQQSVLEPRSECPDGKPAGDHLPVRAEPLQRLAATRLERRTRHHRGDPGAQYPGARHHPRQPGRRVLTLKASGPTIFREPSQTPADPIEKIRVEGLDFYYGLTHALRAVSLSVPGRAITALMGPSGCGKSTLLRVFNRMYSLYPGQRATGKVLLDGEDVLDPQLDVVTLRARVGMVFQRPSPLPMTVFENVAFGLRLNGDLSRSELDARVEAALQQAALWNEVENKLHQDGRSLSGGQQQRLCIARTLALAPTVLLLDEPTAALDPISTLRIEQILDELRQHYCIVIVTHNLQQAARVSDFTAFMLLGQLVESGPTAEIFTKPRNRKTEEYITGRFG